MYIILITMIMDNNTYLIDPKNAACYTLLLKNNFLSN